MADDEMATVLARYEHDLADGVPASTLFHGPSYWELHRLAEAHYAPAVPLFVRCLSDHDRNVRDFALKLVGFHYYLGPDHPVVETMRTMLLNDDDDSVRITAAGVLGVQSAWPDAALLHALDHDPDEIVRGAAFESLCGLAKIPRPLRERMSRAQRHGDLTESAADVRRIVEAMEQGVEAVDALLPGDHER
ncbi:MAG: hypothetical protein NVS2B7_40180 [Herpetosiphon sp.]